MGRLATAAASGLVALGLALVANESAAAQSISATPLPGPTPQQIVEGRLRGDRVLETWTSPTLATFRDEDELRRYLRDLRDAARARRDYWSGLNSVQFAAAETGQQSDSPGPICPTPEDCPVPEAGQGDSSIVVTGSRTRSRAFSSSSPVSVVSSGSIAGRASANPSITNTQEASVDEGDVVKQIGDYLLVLQDGRIFAANTRGGGDRHSLVLTDRLNIYRDRQRAIWYDEMLVFGDHIVVTAYSYRDNASELSVFRLDQATGRLSRQGVFLLSSSDYYSGSNYASRIVDGRLVVYAPIPMRALDPEGRLRWPTLRRQSVEGAAADSRQLFDATGIYRPTAFIRSPMIHSVSICPLEPVQTGADLSCRTTAFVGPSSREFYVSPEHAYLWVAGWERSSTQSAAAVGGSRRCAVRPGRAGQSMQSMLYRLPVAGGAPGVAGVRGRPIDQFSMDAAPEGFRALLRLPAENCGDDDDRPAALGFLSLPAGGFTATADEVDEARYIRMPAIGTTQIENRFTDTHLVYGGRNGYAFDPAEDADDFEAVDSRIVAVPLANPRLPQRLDVPHNVIRAERAGNDIVLTGYADRSGLSVSVVDLAGSPRIGSTTLLRGRFESEGRSHAFNSAVDEHGAGLMGLPTVRPPRRSDRVVWRSDASDISFLAVDANARLRPIGELTGGGNDPNGSSDDNQRGAPAANGYTCEVSCIDWYGNSRPIFTDGRIFALSGTQLVEGTVQGRRIRETQRLDLTMPPTSARADAPEAASGTGSSPP